MTRKVYIMMSAGWGPVARVLPIARALRDASVEVYFHVGGAVDKAFIDAGFKPASPSQLPQVSGWTPTRLWWNLDQYLANLGWQNVEFVEQQFTAYRQVIEEIRPQVIVTDLHPAGAMVARVLQIPTVAVAQSCFLPWRKWPHLVWWQEPPPQLPSATFAINTVLEKYGAAPIRQAEDLLVGSFTVVPSFPEFDPLVNPPESVRYVGPILADELAPSGPPPVSKGGKLTFVYPGRPRDSSGSSGQAIFEAVVPALQKLGIPALVSLGRFDYPAQPAGNGSVEFTPWIPFGQIADRCELFIHHGGHGACLSALTAGVPSLVLPTFAEREYNARNLAALGCARFLPFEQFSPEAVAAQITQLRTDAGYADAAKRWRAALRSRPYGGASEVARLVLECASS